MTVLSIMGTVDRLGFNWRLSASPKYENKATYSLIKRKIEEAPFYWLKILWPILSKPKIGKQTQQKSTSQLQHNTSLS